MAPIAETQRGLVTSAQAARVGVPRLDLSRMAGTGDLERLTHGVYRIVGADEDEYTDVYAHWLALDPDRTAAERIEDRTRIVAVSHRSAARIYGMGDLPVEEHTYTASYRKQSQRSGVRVHTGDLARDDVRVEHGMLVTTPERTIADLHRTEPDSSHVANALADAIYDRRTSRAKVIAAVPGPSERARTRDVDDLLGLRGLDASSLAEALASSVMASDAMSAISERFAETIRVALRDGGYFATTDGIAKSLDTRRFRDAFANVSLPTAVSEPIKKAAAPWVQAAMSEALGKMSWDKLNDAVALQRQVGGEGNDE